MAAKYVDNHRFPEEVHHERGTDLERIPLYVFLTRQLAVWDGSQHLLEAMAKLKKINKLNSW
jgi:hypothetical protein